MTRIYPDVCKHCGGKGKITSPANNNTAANPIEEVCPVCKGTGVITVTEFLSDPYPVPSDPYPLYPWQQPIIYY